MTLPDGLLDAILDVTDGDEVAAEHLARQWQAAIPRMQATADKIRAEFGGRAGDHPEDPEDPEAWS
jgi:hypothetical protein